MSDIARRGMYHKRFNRALETMFYLALIAPFSPVPLVVAAYLLQAPYGFSFLLNLELALNICILLILVVIQKADVRRFLFPETIVQEPLSAEDKKLIPGAMGHTDSRSILSVLNIFDFASRRWRFMSGNLIYFVVASQFAGLALLAPLLSAFGLLGVVASLILWFSLPYLFFDMALLSQSSEVTLDSYLVLLEYYWPCSEGAVSSERAAGKTRRRSLEGESWKRLQIMKGVRDHMEILLPFEEVNLDEIFCYTLLGMETGDPTDKEAIIKFASDMRRRLKERTAEGLGKFMQQLLELDKKLGKFSDLRKRLNLTLGKPKGGERVEATLPQKVGAVLIQILVGILLLLIQYSAFH